MRITPLDVRKQEFRRVVRGLDSDDVYAFLATAADEYEAALTDNKQLRDKVIELDDKVSEYRNMEKTLRDTLITAERVMAESRQNAQKESELILRDANLQADHQTAAIRGEVEALKGQIRELKGHRESYLARLRSLSEAQLGLLESYRKDFEDSEVSIGVETSKPHTRSEVPSAATVAAIPPHPMPEDIAPDPMDSRPQTASLSEDAWRSYSVGEESQAEAASVPQSMVLPEPVSSEEYFSASELADTTEVAPAPAPAPPVETGINALHEAVQAATQEAEYDGGQEMDSVAISPAAVEAVMEENRELETVGANAQASADGEDSRWSLSRFTKGLGKV